MNPKCTLPEPMRRDALLEFNRINLDPEEERQIRNLFPHGRDLPGTVNHHCQIAGDELMHCIALSPVDRFLGHSAGINQFFGN